MQVENLHNDRFLAAAFFQELGAIQSTRELNKYFITYHPVEGFQLERKHSSFWPLNIFIDPIVRLWKTFVGGYSYAFEENIIKLTERIDQNLVQIRDIKACAKSCRNLQKIAKNVFQAKQKDPKQLTERLRSCAEALVIHKAESEKLPPFEICCKYELFEEACELLEQGADIGLLTLESKNKLLGYFLDVCDFPRVELLESAGASLAVHRNKLRPLLHHYLNTKKTAAALKLIELGADRGPSAPNRDDSAVICAVKNGLLPVVQRIVALGDSVTCRDANQDSLLHLAAYGHHYELLEWLSQKLDVCYKSRGQLPYSLVQDSEYFSHKPPFERAFLLDDLATCSNHLAYLPKDQAIAQLTMLRTKYPASCVDHILYTVNKSHFQYQEQISLPAELAPNCSIDELLVLFDQVNFRHPDGANYANPADFRSDTGTTNPRRLRENLVEFLHKVRYRVAYLGTPQAGSHAIETFYHSIERALTHTIRLIKEMPESNEKRAVIKRTVVDYLRAARYCGGKLYANAYQQYVAVMRGVAPTFKDEILDMLGNYREVLFQSLVPEGPQSVHDFNHMLRELGMELGIPGSEMMASFEDYFMGRGFDAHDIRTRFYRLYTTRNIIFECVKQQVEQSNELRGKLFDWFKLNIPHDWQHEEFAALQRNVDDRQAHEEKIAYLESKDIFVAPNQSIEQAIQDERSMRYLALEVVVNMEAPKMEIRSQAIAYMLHRMGILKPVYDWSYYTPIVEFGKGVARSAWGGAKRMFRAFFS